MSEKNRVFSSDPFIEYEIYFHLAYDAKIIKKMMFKKFNNVIYYLKLQNNINCKFIGNI